MSRDARDAAAVADLLLKRGPIVLTSDQREAVRVGIEDVSVWSGRDLAWWRGTLQF